jgi:hypothetical protein
MTIIQDPIRDDSGHPDASGPLVAGSSFERDRSPSGCPIAVEHLTRRPAGPVRAASKRSGRPGGGPDGGGAGRQGVARGIVSVPVFSPAVGGRADSVASAGPIGRPGGCGPRAGGTLGILVMARFLPPADFRQGSPAWAKPAVRAGAPYMKPDSIYLLRKYRGRCSS